MNNRGLLDESANVGSRIARRRTGLDRATQWRYLSSMFKSNVEAQRTYWLLSKARGKNRFIWREGMLPTLLTWLIVVPVVEVFGDHTHSFSARSTVLVSIITLPIMLLGGYLTGSWRWKDFEKKYPE
jgi:hypothetical protein